MDPVVLARWQFAVTAAFHFIFPAITIGFAWLLVIVEWKAWRSSDEVWTRIGRFYGKLFALTFAVGVATGIVMEFQFGTNWAAYSKFVGDIFGAPLAAEALFAFFLESSFLGLYLFGRGRVSKGAHWFSILMVAVGATISAFWILAANSWQQTPAGHVIRNGRAELVSFAAAMFNDSTWPRFTHTMLASLTCGAFFMGGIAAWMALKKRHLDVALRTLKLTVVFGFIVSVASAFPTGHVHAHQVANTQPEKFAAIEGLYGDAESAPLIFFAFPTTKPPELHARFEIKGVLSWLAFGDPEAKVMGISCFPEGTTPQGAELWLSFVSFHNMVALGMMFIGITGLGLIHLARRKLLEAKWFLRFFMLALPLPVLACQFGWVAAEVGRQPWAVYKMLRTADAASVTVPAGNILFSIVMFGLIYLALGALWVYLLTKRIGKGPEPAPAAQGGA
ncbi:MAG: cytochrome ubiquinol oxidase subunit I [Planctomycetota bacterium]|jgi:cytochrome d ubiquinol oxidase subunit I